ncbi:MAG: OB-fold nucleic acid binding domain-containing protein [Actinomycetota bacterium]|nr:OB-fold nucleic acid binding domain-containing protein [Actinomycetota bacterium]
MSLRSVLDRAFASRAELDDAEERSEVLDAGCTPVAAVEPRSLARVTGVVRSVTVRPRAGVQAFEAELYDGSGSLRLLFLGRRQIPGLDVGRHLVAEGRVAELDGGRVIFNPRYELRAHR